MSERNDEVDEFEDDVLQPLPLARFEEYRLACVPHLPQSFRGHHYLILQKRWANFFATEDVSLTEQLSDRCKHRVFAHRDGNASNCTIFGISDCAKDEDDYIIFAFTLQESASELEECFQQSKRIKWNFGPLFTSIHDSDFQVLTKFMKLNDLEWDKRTNWPKHNLCYWYPKEKAKLIEYSVPEDVYVDRLRPEHAEQINDVWPHRSPRSVRYIRTILTLNDDGVGIFDKTTDCLLSWIVATENFTPGFLQTIDSAKGRGLGKLVTKIYCKKFVDRFNLDIVAFVRTNNPISESLFRSVGFEEHRLCCWTKLKTAEEYIT